MYTSSRGIFALTLALPFALLATSAEAQNAAHTHIGHVSTGFAQAPDGAGLLATASADAAVAAQHARLAAADPSNLALVQAHAGHVLHALQPTEGSQGPGSGFGLVRAAEGVAAHIGMAASAAGASQNVTTHAGHVAASATTAAQRGQEAADVARRIQAAQNYADAETLLGQLQTLTQQIVSGRDADGNGQIGWQEGEGGLQQAEQHMGLMLRGEGL